MIESPGNLPRARLRRARLLTSRTHAPTPHGRTLIPRLVSIDAYLGLVMFLMMAEVLKFCELAKRSGSFRRRLNCRPICSGRLGFSPMCAIINRTWTGSAARCTS